MPNMLNEDKEKIIYAEWSDIREELAKIRAELSKKEGHEISEAEFLRRLTLSEVNKRRKQKGKSVLDLDPTSAPGGVQAAPRRSRRAA